MMIATKKTKSHAQALLGIAKDEAKISDAVDAGAHRPSPRGDGLVSSLPQEAAGRRTSDDTPPLTSSATLLPKSRHPWNPAPSALAAPHAHTYADLPPRPSAPPLELLMDEGFFDGPTGNRPSNDAPPPGDEGHARMTPLAEDAVVVMPVCEAVRTVGPTPAQNEEDNDALTGWTVKCGKFMMVGVASLVLVVLGTLIGVVVMFVKQDDSVTTITSSTALMTSTSKPTNSPTTSPSSQPTEFSTPSSPSAFSTTTPEMNTVSENRLTSCSVLFRRRATSHAFIFRYLHLTSSPSPPLCHQIGSNRVKQSSEMLLMMNWEGRWLSLPMQGLW